MKKNDKRTRAERKAVKTIKMQKPYMSEKSVQRFQLFKEQMRKKMHESDEYMFSQEFKMRNTNKLL